MGGGSSVMGMVAYRGTPDDYAEWEAHGAAGWGWNDVLPYYRKLENDLDFGGDMHGRSGPVPIRRTRPDDWAPLSKAVHAFAQERQIPFIADMNADFRDGYGAVPMSNWPDKRASAAICYLDASVRARGNLTIINGATVTGIAVRRAPRHRRDRKDRRRRGEAIPRARDHPVRRRRAFARVPDALRHRARRPPARARHRGARRSARASARICPTTPSCSSACCSIATRGRPRRCGRIPMTAFRYSSGLPGAPPTDMYINVQCKTSWSPLGFQVANLAPTLLKPMARGRVSLVKGDAATPPCVEFNFTGHDLDLRRFMQGFRRAVEILAHEKVRAMTGVTFPVKFTDRLRRLNRITLANKVQSALIAALIDLVPPLAGPIFSTLADRRVDLATLVADDDALAAHIRENVAGTFHPVGTCRMGGANDRDAVVDTEGRVRGIAGLRVIDASIMPTAPRGNTNIPTIMVAEKISAAMADEARAAA